jgi:hypothetical protein
VVCGKKQARCALFCAGSIGEQTAWLERGDEICAKFIAARGRLKNSKISSNTLMSFVEKIASECGCHYELSNECKRKIGDISILSVSANFAGITLQEFIDFSEAITVDGVRIGNADFMSGKDGTLSIKCSVEAMVLDEG